MYAGDVGNVGAPGSFRLDGGLEPLTADAVRVEGAGTDIWGEEDGFHFAYWPVRGDVDIEARVVSVDDTDP